MRITCSPYLCAFGPSTLWAFQFSSGLEHAVVVFGDSGAAGTPLVRVQSSCLTGTALGAQLCDCKQQLDLSLEQIAKVGFGCAIYLDQEGRGHGLVEKVAQLSFISQGLDTVDAALTTGRAPDVRDYVEAASILDYLYGARPIRLLTNNPKKLDGVCAAGVLVLERVPIEAEPNQFNRHYLEVKKIRMGHLLTKV